MKILPIIVAGGSGSRLWPVSRTLHPKPFIALPDSETLLGKAFARAADLTDVDEMILVTNREHFFQSYDEYRKTGIKAQLHAILEPVGRNTNAAVAMAALCARNLNPKSVLLVLPADQIVTQTATFAALVAEAVALAERDYLVTFGIRPDRPETGFGYIEPDQDRPILGGHYVRRFKEKPDLETARRFVADGSHLWNSGMFCFTAETFLREMDATNVGLLALAEQAWQAARCRRNQACPGVESFELDIDSFTRMPDISVDYAVIEKSNRVAVVAGDIGWSDLGSWGAVSALTPTDADGNRVVGESILIDSHNNFIQADGRLIATVGVDDLIIVDSPDALLVAASSRGQDVKQVTEKLRFLGHDTHRLHRTVHRPWGIYTILTEEPGYKVKRISVKPGASLSLQLHHHRAENWVVVEGTASVTVGDRTFDIGPTQSAHIPIGTKHRLENRSDQPLVIIEVQAGAYLGEDDIVRFADVYDRTKALG